MKCRRRILARTSSLTAYCVLFPVAAFRFHRAVHAPWNPSTSTNAITAELEQDR